MGRRYGRLVVLQLSDHPGKVRCRCDCGTEKDVRIGDMRKGRTASCGCLHKEITSRIARRHGETVNATLSQEYVVWSAMMQRCYDPNYKCYKHYGGRGIVVCDRWHNVAAFIEDMGRRPKGMLIDRIDNDGNYEPGNCRWATKGQQAINKRNTVFVEFDGARKPLCVWASELGMPRSALYSRIVTKRWDVERAMTQPLRGTRRN